MIRNSLIRLSKQWRKQGPGVCAIESADNPSGVTRSDNAHAVRPEQSKKQ